MANERLKAFLKMQGRMSPGEGGSGTDFYKKVNGKQVGRLFQFQNAESGEREVCFQFFSHYGDKGACPRTFDRDAPCEKCEQAHLLFEEGTESSKKEAWNLAAKRRSWFAFAPQGEEKFTIVELPAASTQKLFCKVAMKGGWQDTDPNWEDDAFITAFEAGVQKVFGPKGHDLIWTFNPNSKDKKKMHDFSLSERPGKDLSGLGDAPDMAALFKRIKGTGTSEPDSEEASVPKEEKKAKLRKPKPRSSKK